jgi:hypothetical protein
LSAAHRNPHQDRFAGRLGDFKLDRPLGFLLHDDGARGDAIAVGNIAHAQPHQITAAQLAVDRQVEQGELVFALAEFEAYPDGPNVFELEAGFLSDQLALVPRLAAGFAFKG